MRVLPSARLLLAFSAIAATTGGPARAADHLDAPALRMPGQGTRDINDLYVFQSPTNADNTVLILTVNPAAGALSPTEFGTEVTYQFQIDNSDDGMTGADVTFAANFGVAEDGSQEFSLTRNGQSFATGSTGSTTMLDGGGQLTADVFDDPFFFDLNGFNTRLEPGGGFSEENPVDFFAGLNVSAIVLEVSSSELTGTNGSNIAVWGRTLVDGGQVDRIGRPAINTVLITGEDENGAAQKDLFNLGDPADDPADFAAIAQGVLTSPDDVFQRTAEDAMGLTDILLPDVLTFDTSSSAGFLNGRRLEDDVIDAELNLLTGGAVVTDFVSTNDVPFLNAFPFLAPANAAVPEPTGIAMAAAAATVLGARRRRRSV